MTRQTPVALLEPQALNASFCRWPLQGGLQGADVLHLERRSFNAWPAPQTLLMGGWVVRAAGGYTKRANSANAMQAGAALDEPLLHEIEQVYARMGQPCIFRISPLANAEVDALLQARGYQLQDPSLFMHRPGQPADLQGTAIVVEQASSRSWLEGVCKASSLPPHQQALHSAIVGCIGLRCGYASIVQNGQTVAWGLAVLEKEAAGLYDVVVVPQMRGRGLGRMLLKGLLRWAAEQGVRSTDLQVAGSNHVAQTLYASLGFEPVYGYHYRIGQG